MGPTAALAATALSILRYAQGNTMVPSGKIKQPEINAAITEVVRLMTPDVVHIRFNIDRDWSGDWAIFFRVLLSDEAGKRGLPEVANQVRWQLSERLDFDSMGLFAYYNFRTVSEQEALREESWA